MKLKAVLGILPALLLIGTLTLVVNVQPISAVESPYIAVVPDSLVDPSLTPGENFTVSIYTDYNGSDVWGWQFSLSYNPNVLHGVTVNNGDLITKAKDPSAVFLSGTFDNTAGILTFTCAVFNFTSPPAPLTSGPGTLANVTFTVVGYGASDITIDPPSKLVGWDWTRDPYDYDIINATFTNTNTWTGDGVTSVFYTTEKPIAEGSEKVYLNQTLMSRPADYTIDYDTGEITFTTAPGVGEEIKATYDYINYEHIQHGYFDNRLPNDVAVGSVTAPAKAAVESLVPINVTVANIGKSDEEASVTIRYDTAYIDSQNVTLAKGENKTVSFSWNTTGVAQGVYYTVNATATIPGDGDLTNNWKTTTILLAVHDVAVKHISAPATAAVGELVPINVTVANIGAFDEVAGVTILYDATAIDSQNVTLLMAELKTVSFNWDTTGMAQGVYVLNATVTIPGDGDPSDNWKTTTILFVEQVPVHDVAVISVTPSPTSVVAGELVNIMVLVENQGTVNEDFDVTAYYDTIAIGTQTVINLPPGATTSMTFTWDTTGVPSGTYTIRAEATLVEGEVDTSDNMLVDGTVTVTSPPAPPMLSIKLSGEHDYLFMENVKVRLAALVKDAATMEPVSDADVTVEIYGSDGVLWVSDVMVEMVASTGIYEWESEGTIRQLRLAKGVYLVHVQASHQGGPTASDILEFHVDPPAGGTNQTLYHIAFTAVALVGLAGLILKRRQIADRLRRLSRRN